MNRIIFQEDLRTPVVHRVKAGTPSGATLAMTQGESVECQCTTDFTCQIMEMLCGGRIAMVHWYRLHVLVKTNEKEF